MHPRFATRHPVRVMKSAVDHKRLSPVSVAGQAGRCLMLAALLLAAGCTATPYQPSGPPAAGGAVSVNASNAADSALLDALDGLPDSQRRTYDGHILEAGNRFTAASGCECRYVRLLDAAGRPLSADRLACRDGVRRFFAVDVFRATPETRQRP